MVANGSQFALSLSYDIENGYSGFPGVPVDEQCAKELSSHVKDYVLKLNDVAREYGVHVHYFVVGALLEDADFDYLRRTRDDGHAIGNHTYNHINVKAQTIADVGARYRLHPWLAGGRTALECIREEIHTTNLAIRDRLGVTPAGFRAPGGVSAGLSDVPALQEVLLDEGLTFSSSHYEFPLPHVRWPAPEAIDTAARASVDQLQPYRYPSGLREMLMTGVSDRWALRTDVYDLGRKDYVRTLLATIDYAYEKKDVLTLLFHPNVLAIFDPDCIIAGTVLKHALGKPGGCRVTDIETLSKEALP